MRGTTSAPDSSPRTFRAQSALVLVPFHVTRRNSYVSDLKPADVVLLEDGRPRAFSIFEGPTQQPAPLELILLFDTTTWPTFIGWDLTKIYDFIQHWDNAMSHTVLEADGPRVRVSVYHFDGVFLERLCRPTVDPEELTSAFRQLLTPIPILSDKMTPSQRQQLEVAVKALAGKNSWRPRIDQPGIVAAGVAMPMEVPSTSQIRDAGSGSPGLRGWPLEAAISTLKDSAAASGKALRMLIMFSEGAGGTTTVEEDVAEQALAFGIPVFPVILYPNWNVGLSVAGSPPGRPPVHLDPTGSCRDGTRKPESRPAGCPVRAAWELDWRAFFCTRI